MKKMHELYKDGEESKDYKISKTPGKFIGGKVVSVTTLIEKSTGDRIMYDDNHTISLYNESLPTMTKGDILVVGLGTGMLGYNFADRCVSFDYVEISQDLVDFISHRLPNCNFYQGDAYTWETTKKYDSIFLDIFHKKTPDYNNGIIQLVNKYKGFLKEGGQLSYLTIHRKKPIPFVGL
jgi:SAM-dependent methyltransferase